MSHNNSFRSTLSYNDQTIWKFPSSNCFIKSFYNIETKKVIFEDLKNGKIDLLVGTHRILSKDVVFKDLGLLCIDEDKDLV